MNLLRPAFVLVALACGFGCRSEITETVDAERQAAVELLADCLPEQLDKLSALLQFAKLWRLADGENPSDAPGLVWSEQSNGTLAVAISPPGYTLAATISFYSPAGVRQNLDVTAGSLAQAIEDAAEDLRAGFSGSSFLVCEWVMSGPTVAGSGAITAILAPVGQPNRLLELRSTTATPAGGPPPLAPGTIALTGSHACTLACQFTALQTDTSPSRDIPSGDVHFELVGASSSAAGQLRFRATDAVKITVVGLKGYFEIDLDTYEITVRR
jgi:hypothetical protein